MSPPVIRRAVTVACLALLIVLAATILASTQGHFVYTLDDPYIHLALARQISLGHYGINVLEPAAPSSSLLWPLLLAPFANLAHGDLAPLLINSACLLVTASLLMRFFEQHFTAWAAALLTLATVWSLNLFGLVFTGMEHSLQVLLVTLVAVTIGGLALPRPLFFTALTLLPWVRYEDLAISLPVLVWRASAGERRASFVAGTLMLAGLAGFSAFLHGSGLGWLPSSVLAKQQALSSASQNRLHSLYSTFCDNLSVMRSYAAAILVLLLSPAPRRRAPAALAVLTITATLVFLFGSNGWFGRYEVYFLVFATVMIAAIALPLIPPARRNFYAPVIAAGFVLVNIGLWPITLLTPGGARNIAEQQLQMSTIVRDHLHEPVAVNDLGLVAFRGGQYVLDLWGLGSLESLKARFSDPSGRWIPDAMRRHRVEFAFVYSDWFPNPPTDWIRVGELRLIGPLVTSSSRQVSLFASNPDAAQRLRQALEHYRGSSPQAAGLLFLAPDS